MLSFRETGGSEMIPDKESKPLGGGLLQPMKIAFRRDVIIRLKLNFQQTKRYFLQSQSGTFSPLKGENLKFSSKVEKSETKHSKSKR